MCYRDSEGFSERLAPRLHHRKRAESRRDSLVGGLALDLSAIKCQKGQEKAQADLKSVRNAIVKELD
jgi:hypothetical protein